MAEFAPQRVAQGKQNLARARRDKDEARIKTLEAELDKLRKEGKGEIPVPFLVPKAADAEHLRFWVECDGYQARAMNDNTPAGGVEFDVHADFGTLHGALKFEEVFAAADHKADAKKPDAAGTGK